jgi:hypothetical protein
MPEVKYAAGAKCADWNYGVREERRVGIIAGWALCRSGNMSEGRSVGLAECRGVIMLVWTKRPGGIMPCGELGRPSILSFSCACDRLCAG